MEAGVNISGGPDVEMRCCSNSSSSSSVQLQLCSRLAVLRRSAALTEQLTKKPNKRTSSDSHTGTFCAFIIPEPQKNNSSAAMNRLPSARVAYLQQQNMKI